MDEKIEQSLVNTKMTVPPRARPISQLKLDSAEPVKSSSNKVSLVKKIAKFDLFWSEKLYYLKEHNKNSHLAELEAYCGVICQFIATSEYAPSIRPYYNQKGEIFAVASKAFMDFKSNYEDPLQMEDTIIESSLIQIEQHRRILIIAIKKALENYEKITPSSSDILSSTSNLLNSFFAANHTIYKTKCAFSNFLKQSNKFSIESLNSLFIIISARINYFLSTSKDQVSDEYQNLKQINDVIAQLNKLHRTEVSQDITVEILDQIDKKLKNEDINLESFSEFINVEINGIRYKIRVNDLENYRILKGLAVSLTTRFIFKEADNNNSNMSKKGYFFDFDWTKANILLHFKELNLFEQLIRQPSEESFVCNPKNIEHFPNVGDKYLFYWPTKQPEIQQIIFDQISHILHRLANFQFEGKHDIAEQMMHLFVQLNDYLAKTPQTNISYWGTVTNFMYNLSINLRAFISGQPTQELIAEDNIKYLFTNLEQQFHYFIKNLGQPIDVIINTGDKNEIKRMFNQISQQLQELKDIYTGLIAAVKLSYKHPEFYNNNALLEQKKLQEILDRIKQFCNLLLNSCQTLLLNLESNIESFHRNSFTKKDNEVYQSLATHPVFIFHKYKTFLKYILTNKELYDAFARLNMSHISYIDEEGEEQNLHETLIQDELKRIKEIIESLLEMQDFKLFLEEHGQYAFQLIKEEFATEKRKYSSKTNCNFNYEQIINALDFDRIEQEFLELCEECGINDSMALQML